VTDQWFPELDTQHRQLCRTSSDPAHDPAFARDQESTGSFIALPEVGTARPAADHIGHIVVADDASIDTKVELLPLTVSLHGRWEENVDALRFSVPRQNAQQVCIRESERENVIVPQGIAKEIGSVKHRPATILRKAGDCATVLLAFPEDLSIVNVLDAHIAILKVPAVLFVWITVKNRRPFVRSYFEFPRKRESVWISLQLQQEPGRALERQSNARDRLPLSQSAMRSDRTLDKSDRIG
jgi:hypothetical protein